jgi:lincosamide nucleotidyltransferase
VWRAGIVPEYAAFIRFGQLMDEGLMLAPVNPPARLDALAVLDTRIRAALLADDRVLYALAYGSRTQTRADGSPAADEWSDLEYYAFVGAGQTVDAFAFLRSITPVALEVVNPFGTPNIVTPDLLRVELHIEPESALEQVRGWPHGGGNPARMLLKDQGGTLATVLADWASRPPFASTLPGSQTEFDNMLNWLVFASAVALRGEHLRAWELLNWVYGGLLRLTRTLHGAPQPQAPARNAERDLPPEVLAALNETTRGTARQACLAASALARALAAHLKLNPRSDVLDALQAELKAPVDRQ